MCGSAHWFLLRWIFESGLLLTPFMEQAHVHTCNCKRRGHCCRGGAAHSSREWRCLRQDEPDADFWGSESPVPGGGFKVW